MDLSNEFEVGVPIDEAWAVLTDVEGIAPCLPGAQLQEIITDGDGHQEYHGTVKVKVGPITAQYKGAARFASKDDAAYTAVLSASGRDTRGQGNANATITATLRPNGDASTSVSVLTELNLTGKVAQFGRGVLADVSKKLLDQFVDNLERTVLTGASAPVTAETEPPATDTTEAPGATGATGAAEAPEAAPAPEPAAPADSPAADTTTTATTTTTTTSRRVDAPEVDAVDLLDAAGAPVVKRVLPIVGVAAAVFVILRIVRRRRRG